VGQLTSRSEKTIQIDTHPLHYRPHPPKGREFQMAKPEHNAVKLEAYA